jgi:branched-chain amino acid transport system ATP-binding protein
VTTHQQPANTSSPGAAGDAVLVVESLGVRFGGLRALQGVSLSVRRGEIVGLIGPNGAGKTTLVNCLSGVVRNDSGSMTFEGKRIDGWQPHALSRAGIGRTFQNVSRMSGIGARDLILLGRERFMPAGVLPYLLPNAGRWERAQTEVVLDIAEHLGILDCVAANQPVDVLPYGTRKLVDIGRALACEPRLLLLDEPVAGMNREEKDAIRDAITRTRQRHDIAQLVVEHDLAFIGKLVDRVYVIASGASVTHGSYAEVMAHPDVIEKYLGTAVAPSAEETYAATPSTSVRGLVQG